MAVDEAIKNLICSISPNVIDEVEGLVGKGSGAWDMVDPREIVASVIVACVPENSRDVVLQHMRDLQGEVTDDNRLDN